LAMLCSMILGAASPFCDWLANDYHME